MKIDKDTILDLIKTHAGKAKADDAAKHLPNQVDTDEDRGLLAKYGIDVDDLLAKLPGGLGDKIDNLPGSLGKKLDDIL